MLMGGAWKRLGPMNWKGEARSENTGSVSQNCPPTFNSMVECPRRHRLPSGAASRSVRSTGCTGMGARGTVSASLPVAKFHSTLAVLAAPSDWRGLALRYLPPSCSAFSVCVVAGKVVQDDVTTAMARAPIKTVAMVQTRERRRGMGKFRWFCKCALHSVV